MKQIIMTLVLAAAFEATAHAGLTATMDRADGSYRTLAGNGSGWVLSRLPLKDNDLARTALNSGAPDAWGVVPVDVGANDCGTWTSMAVRGPVVHVAYWVYKSSSPVFATIVRYARSTNYGANWTIETADTSTNYPTSSCLMGWFRGGLDVDTLGRPHIAYTVETQTSAAGSFAIHSVRLGPNNWKHDTVEMVNVWPEICHDADIKIDSRNRPCVVYTLYGARSRYAVQDGNAWTRYTIPDTLSYGVALALDRNDNPHVAIGQLNNLHYCYSTNGGTTWTIENVTASWWHCDIALGKNDQPLLVHAVSSNGLWFARRDGPGNWYRVRVDDGGSNGTRPAVFFNPADSSIHVAWYRSNSPWAMHSWSTNNGQSWSYEAIGGASIASSCNCPDYVQVPYGRFLAFESPGYRVSCATDVTPITDNVGCTRIISPAGTVDSGMALTPACSVYNYGMTTVNYSVRLKIGTGYNATATVTSHAPGTRAYATFPAWTAAPRGSIAVSCSTELSGDAVPSNDKATGTVSVLVHDVGATAVKVPAGALDSGTTVIPACSLYNYGNAPESYPARLKIGAGYDFTTAVVNHPAGAPLYVTFPAWTATARGTWATSCSTELAVDAQPANDRATGSVDIAVHDVAVKEIIAPAALVGPGSVAPSARLHNHGTAREGLTASFTINALPPYTATLNLSNGLPVGTDTTVSFPEWNAVTGSFVARCSVFLASEQVPANDTLGKPFEVGEVDIEATAIGYPTGNIDSSGAVLPWATVRNAGDVAVACEVFFRIDSAGGTVYSARTTVSGLQPDSSTIAVFDTWAKPHRPGNYTTRCSVYAAGDANPANDAVGGTFRITGPVSETGWVRKADVPLGARSKKVKDGGALAWAEMGIAECGLRNGGVRSTADAGFVYAFKGNGRYEFYAYNTTDNTWTTLDSIPAIGNSGRKKAVKKGAALAVADGRVYGCKGNNSLELWEYSPAPGLGPGAWVQKSDVPLGARALKEGTGMAAVKHGETTFIYLLKGSGTTEFYRYSIADNAWESRAPAPVDVSGKAWKNGSALCAADDGTLLFALKGSYNERADYSVADDAWITRTPLPMLGRLGRKKKVKDGAGMAYHAGALYALKGGNTNEFWQYEITGDRWTQFADIPAGSGRNVKGGGALCAVDQPWPALYALKGNNTLDFFKYGFGAMTNDQAPMTNAGIQNPNVGTASLSRLRLRVAPNPAPLRNPHSAIRIEYSLPNAGNVSLRLYDVTGKLVKILAEGNQAAGAHALTLGHQDLTDLRAWHEASSSSGSGPGPKPPPHD